MPRYVRQKTMSECGPVAILNILKWAGIRVTYERHIADIKWESDYEYNSEFKGIRWHNMSRAIKKLSGGKLRFREKSVIDLKILTNHVNRGGAFIFWHSMSEDDAHYSTVVPAKDGKFAWLNVGPTFTSTVVSPLQFERRVMNTAKFSDQPLALLISKI